MLDISIRMNYTSIKLKFGGDQMDEYRAELEAICQQIADCDDAAKIAVFLAFGEGFAAGLGLGKAG